MSKPYHSDDTCYPLEKGSSKGWSLSEIFGRKLEGVCLLAESESQGYEEKTVCLHVPHQRSVFVSPGAVEWKDADGSLRCFTLPRADSFDLAIPEQEPNGQLVLAKPALHAERTIIGHGQERGGMRVILTNPSPTDSVDFIYFESLPWFLRPYLHTLRATIAGPDGGVPRATAASHFIKEIFYQPAVDRKRGTQLELAVSVPAASTVTLTYDFEKAFLRYTEYPPDANRGFNVAPAVIRLTGEENTPVYIRTTSLLLPLPTPDFSMPYNVIILTSTVIALAFGSIFNMLTRRFVLPEEARALAAQTWKGQLRSKVVTIRDKLRGKSAKTE